MSDKSVPWLTVTTAQLERRIANIRTRIAELGPGVSRLERRIRAAILAESEAELRRRREIDGLTSSGGVA